MSIAAEMAANRSSISARISERVKDVELVVADRGENTRGNFGRVEPGLDVVGDLV